MRGGMSLIFPSPSRARALKIEPGRAQAYAKIALNLVRAQINLAINRLKQVTYSCVPSFEPALEKKLVELFINLALGSADPGPYFMRA